MLQCLDAYEEKVYPRFQSHASNYAVDSGMTMRPSRASSIKTDAAWDNWFWVNYGQGSSTYSTVWIQYSIGVSFLRLQSFLKILPFPLYFLSVLVSLLLLYQNTRGRPPRRRKGFVAHSFGSCSSHCWLLCGGRGNGGGSCLHCGGKEKKVERHGYQ